MVAFSTSAMVIPAGRAPAGPRRLSSSGSTSVTVRVVAQVDDLDPLGVLVDPAPQLLDLELEVDQAPQDELSSCPPGRRRPVLARLPQPHREAGCPAPSSTSAGMSDARISAPGASTTIDSIRFRSWRTLPGQGALTSRCMRLGSDAPEGAVVRLGELPDEPAHQERDVLPPLAQRAEGRC